ncbi:Membrane-anchored ribosome-binding protein, inhibits growth in stationary phase, ElaB/YqjD/DUF883 family [Methylophilus rhizosphaerae]|uniref:Membrane-anchored ribosome-binding protein, inhibits growth in stationary phase, ElaB/YqjD/DUF883 family n=1 Tax=Methylophilus rhizosphaerae TaxID=492660 RepID=A0A1G9BST1_9PROT|nr:DUF883 family protein [Methylophilus rhizosphaerae]SDK42551.1 Membrane-anchored ribosome-binding protein, inhibits growth in stationary phase, ElaB/YqjD/DUF883 family [Methylophilus rhizosphaerae]
MFNFSKDNVEQTTDRLAKQSDHAIEEIASQVKSTANDLLEAVQDTTENTQDKAKELIRTLKSNIDRLTSEDAASIASKISAGAGRVKDQVQQEFNETYHTLKDRTADTVQEHPLGTVLVAAGVGLLVGYLLGAKRRDL